MLNNLSPVPTTLIGENHIWREWYQRVRVFINNIDVNRTRSNRVLTWLSM